MTSPDTRGRTESQARTWSRAPGCEAARRATMPAILPRRASVGRFKIVTQHAPAVSFGVSGGGYKLEMEALGALDAEIVEVTAQTEDEFIAAARDADALIAKGRPITRRIIESLQRCQVIALGSVGADAVDVPPAHHDGPHGPRRPMEGRPAAALAVPAAHGPDARIRRLRPRRPC